MSLSIAAKAEQSLILPAVLAAHWINESKPDTIVVKFEDADTLKKGDKNAVVEFNPQEGSPTLGGPQVVAKLVDSFPTILKGKQDKLVSLASMHWCKWNVHII
jgi:hypothetical protein